MAYLQQSVAGLPHIQGDSLALSTIFSIVCNTITVAYYETCSCADEKIGPWRVARARGHSKKHAHIPLRINRLQGMPDVTHM